MRPEDDHGFPDAPLCPVCSAELTREPLATDTAISVAYGCPEHGLAFVIDPFS